jgi:hypothetical protein
MRDLCEKSPKTAQEGQQHITALLEDAPDSACAKFSEEPEGSASFGLAQKYEGNALRRFPVSTSSITDIIFICIIALSRCVVVAVERFYWT